MALIDTDEAAKRLARVILSDIELYFRERPRLGETLDGQIDEGRRLFASRVVPALAPLFDVVLADRRATTRHTPPLAAQAPAPAEIDVAAADASLADHPTPGPAEVGQIVEALALPAGPAGAAIVVPVAQFATPGPSPAAEATPAGVLRVAPAPAPAPAPIPVYPAEVPVPVLTSGFSWLRLLAVLVLLAAAAAVIDRALR